MATCFTSQDRTHYDVLTNNTHTVALHNTTSFVVPEMPTACLGGFVKQMSPHS